MSRLFAGSGFAAKGSGLEPITRSSDCIRLKQDTGLGYAVIYFTPGIDVQGLERLGNAAETFLITISPLDSLHA
jgi:hypothetical protein